jgi:hypothetical protein
MTNRLTTIDFSDITSGQVTAAVYDANSNSYDGVLLEYDSSGNYTGNYQEWHALPYTWTVGSNKKLRICVKRSNNYEIDADNTKIMLNTGSTALPYQPYLAFKDIPYTRLETATDTITDLPKTTYNDGTNATVAIKGNMQQSGTPTPTSPITPSECGERTENLLDYSTFVNDYWLNNNTGLPQPYNNGGRIATTSPIDVNNVNNVTFNFTSGVANTQFMYSLFNGSTLIERVTGLSRETTIDVSNGDTLYLCLYRTTGLPITISDVSNAMLNVGSTAKPYEPYGYKIPIVSGGVTTNVYLSEPLRKIGDYADTIAADGTVTRVIKKYVITGQENWGVHGSIASWFYADNIINPIIPTDATLTPPTITSHFKVRAYAYAVSISNGECTFGHPSGVLSQFRTILKNTDYTTVEDFTDWLKAQYNNGNPVTIWYASETPTTETATMPTIPTTSGGQTFDVDTSLKPSEVDLTYHGWHEHEAEKYSRTENLFDKDNASIYTYTNITTTNWTYDDSQPTKCFRVPCEAGKTYTLSLNTSDTVSTFRIFITDSSNVPTSNDKNITGTVVYRGSYSEPVTFTTTNETYIVVMYGRAQFDNLLEVTMLNEGSTAKPYQPYLDWE